jgi:hypothetical protein
VDKINTMMEIRNFGDFKWVLGRTLAEVDGMILEQPDRVVWLRLKEQLQSMKGWTDSGEHIDRKKIDSLDIGRIVQGLEPASTEPSCDPFLRKILTQISDLQQYWRSWPGNNQIALRPASGKPWVAVAVVILIAALTTITLATVRFAARTQAGPWTPLAGKMPAGHAIASLETSLEPYTISLHPNPEDERYRVRLRIAEPAEGTLDKFVPIAEHMRAGDLRFDARLLGDDGHRLWFFVKQLGAWDYRDGRLVTLDDLRKANPGLGEFASRDNSADPLVSKAVRDMKRVPQELWTGQSRLYAFTDRLQVTTPDFRRVYAIDPVTLRASVR